MYLWSGFNSNNATSFVKVNSNSHSCLNTGVIKSLAKKFRIQRREKKMDFTVLIGSAVELASSHRKSHMLSIEALRQRYMKDTKVHISPKCFHNGLDQRRLADFANASAFQIHQLYRLRWLVELFMKCLKSGNGLQGINSSKQEIVFFWITICVLSSVLKSIFAKLSLQGNKNTALSTTIPFVRRLLS